MVSVPTTSSLEPINTSPVTVDISLPEANVTASPLRITEASFTPLSVPLLITLPAEPEALEAVKVILSPERFKPPAVIVPLLFTAWSIAAPAIFALNITLLLEILPEFITAEPIKSSVMPSPTVTSKLKLLPSNATCAVSPAPK